MKRERATEMLEELLLRASGHDWPVEAVQAVWVFGSYSRGAVEPGDVDVAIDLDRSDDRWRSHFVDSMVQGRSPFGVVRKALRGRRRGYEFVFKREHGYDDVPMTLLWERGESLATARERLQAIPVDPAAGRAPRDAMRPCFEGLEHRVPRALREELGELMDDNAVTVDKITLDDAQIDDPWVHGHIEHRWNPASPLRRAAHAALAHLAAHDIDPHAVHLHGKDVDHTRTPHFVGFQLRYLSAALNCFTERRRNEGRLGEPVQGPGPSPAPRACPHCGEAHDRDVPAGQFRHRLSEPVKPRPAGPDQHRRSRIVRDYLAREPRSFGIDHRRAGARRGRGQEAPLWPTLNAAPRILYGIPCAGKSTAAISEATHHELRTVIGTDHLREVQRLLTPLQQAPALRMVTHTAWQRHGPPTRDNIATGFREHVAAVAPAIHAVVAKLVRDGFDAVLEGAHFHGDLIGELPASYPELAVHATVLVVGSADELRQRPAVADGGVRQVEVFQDAACRNLRPWETSTSIPGRPSQRPRQPSSGSSHQGRQTRFVCHLAQPANSTTIIRPTLLPERCWS